MMTAKVTGENEQAVSCANCTACCCRLQVMLLTETGVPQQFIETDQWGGRTMLQLDDGWCAALDRNSLMCSIYEQRPQVCRDYETGAFECLTERSALR